MQEEGRSFLEKYYSSNNSTKYSDMQKCAYTINLNQSAFNEQSDQDLPGLQYFRDFIRYSEKWICSFLEYVS